MLLEVILQLDPFKSISERVSTSMLDYVGDLGGFFGAISGAFAFIGQFFSAKMFIASISNNLYFRKLSNKESKKQVDEIEKMEKNIENKKKFKEDLLNLNV
jgi:hypothetical protein